MKMTIKYTILICFVQCTYTVYCSQKQSANIICESRTTANRSEKFFFRRFRPLHAFCRNFIPRAGWEYPCLYRIHESFSIQLLHLLAGSTLRSPIVHKHINYFDIPYWLKSSTEKISDSRTEWEGKKNSRISWRNWRRNNAKTHTHTQTLTKVSDWMKADDRGNATRQREKRPAKEMYSHQK